MFVPKIEDNKIILNGNRIDTKLKYNISPKCILSYYNHLHCSYGFTLNKLSFLGKNRMRFTDRSSEYMSYNYSQNIIKFIILCKKLDDLGLDISDLIKEFNHSQNKNYDDEIRHTLSLAKLSHYYLVNGYEIKLFPKKGDKKPDMQINNVICDLKVRRGTDKMLELLHACGYSNINDIPQGETKYTIDLMDRFCFEIGTVIRDRLHKGTQQAEALFFDLSFGYQSEIHEKWPKDLKPVKPLNPIKYRCIFFSNHGQYIEDEFDFLSTFIDFDPRLWHLLGESKIIIDI